ncbi:MAG: hypothetical protein HC923_13785, partial [Myxococcales bacterium]|nr:hypothetical protein [Myxococcales bacterium]
WSNGVGRIRVASRTLAAAERLAEAVQGTAASLDDLPLLLSSADIVICSTAAPGFVIDKKMVANVLRNRRYRPLLLVDIAVPRDVDPRVGELDNVFVYDVDDLEGVLEQNRQKRQKEADAAEAIVREEVARFASWRNAQRVVPVIKALRTKASSVVQAEIERTLAGQAALDPKLEKKVRAMGNAIMNKLLHPVLTRLKVEGGATVPDIPVEMVLDLFDLTIEPEPLNATAMLDDERAIETGSESVSEAVGEVASNVVRLQR